VNPPTLTQKIGCWLNERPAMERALRAPMGSPAWLDLCNRHETVSRCEDGLGRFCEWQESSRLSACRIFPRIGGRLLRHTACEHPFSAKPKAGTAPVSIIIPLRGRDREPAVSFVASVLLSAAGPESEVLICEHDTAPSPQGTWPAGVRTVFIPAQEGEPFNKSKAMNIGAREARHPVLLLHDADAWVSDDYLSIGLEKMAREGWEAIRPVRFLFLLDEIQSRECLQTGSIGDSWALPKVQQNNPGLSTFVRRDTYFKLGGHDERFTGWGYEDVEFLDRLQTRRWYPGGYLPAIHLWHGPSPAKRQPRDEFERLQQIMKEPVEQRIERARRQIEQGGKG
jgi:N-terminal domain of galactosyltransferase